jgi:hypothetical protein
MRKARRTSMRFLRQHRVIDLGLEVAENFGYTVQSGPFKGMKYTRSAVATRHATPCLMGTYERQIYPFLLEAAAHCEQIVDIGSAEGYFAVGLARLTGKPVTAFDVDPNERKICRGMAQVNGVTISLQKWCSAGVLQAMAFGRRLLILSDIDGGEIELFGPNLIRSLRHCDVVVELHGVSAEANRLFIDRWRGGTHEVNVLEAPPAEQNPEIARLIFLDSDVARMAVEHRPYQQWITCRGIR